MTVQEFREKWSPLKLLLAIIVLDGNETPKQKRATTRMLHVIFNPEIKQDIYSEELINRFDIFCEKIVKKITAVDAIKRLIHHQYFRTALGLVSGLDESQRLINMEFILKSYSSSRNEYDKFPCINLQDLYEMNFSSDNNREKFFQELFQLYLTYGFLKNALYICKHILRRKITNEELRDLRQRSYLGIEFGDAYRLAGRILINRSINRPDGWTRQLCA